MSSFVESLESRQLFSVTAGLDPEGAFILNVAVDGYVQVKEVAPLTFEVTDGLGSVQTFSDIESVKIKGGDGADKIVLSAFSGTLAATIEGGNGDDLISVEDNFNQTGATIDRLVGFQVHGNNGRDYFHIVRGSNTQVYGQNGDDVAFVCSGTASIYGGNGSDVVLVGSDASLGTSTNLGKGANYIHYFEACPTA